MSDASDPIEVRAYNVSAQLAPGRYRIIRPVGADALHVSVERGHAWVRELTGDHKGVILRAGEEASVL